MPPLTVFGQAAPVDPAAIDPKNPAVNDPSITDPTMRRIAELEGRRTAALAILASTDPNAVPQKRVAQATIAKLEPQLSAAYRDAASNERASAKVLTSGASVSSPAAMLQAAAAQSRADAMTTRADAYAEGTSNKRAQLEADANLKNADAKVAGLKADLATATQPDQINSIHTALQQALQNVEATKQDNVTKGLNNDILTAKAGTAVQTAAADLQSTQAKAASAGSQSQIDAANAANAVAASAAGLTKSQADAGTAQTQYQDALANFNALTPDMRTQAAQDALATKRTALDQANENLKLAQDQHQGVLDQQKATLAQTQGVTQKALLGPAYGLQDQLQALSAAQDKARQMAAGVRAGTLDPVAAVKQLSDYVSATIAGTTPFEQQKTALDTETTRRQQDSSLAGNQMSAASSLGGSLFGNMMAANKDAPAGSSAMAQSYGGMMGVMMNAMHNMGPSTPVNSPLLNSMSSAGGVQPTPTPPAAAPSTTIAPDGTVTIAHTPQIPPTPQIAPIPILGQANTSDATIQGGGPVQNPALFGGMGPAMPHHVDALWANDPNLNPQGTPVSSGAQTSY